MNSLRLALALAVAKVEGTRAERKAERKEIRADLKEANRRGEIPMVTEAGLGVGR